MLVARRDPPLYGDTHNAVPPEFHAQRQPKAPRIARFVTFVQVFGSLLAVPVGIGSAYSFYRANFSPETTCQNLRSGIISMLDKSVDASTRRILVRRDVEAFEKSCGEVDPEATTAFKALLASDKALKPAAAVTPQQPKTHVETVIKEVKEKESVSKVEKIEARPQPSVRPTGASTAHPVETARREPTVSDAQWLDAVRNALVTHKPESTPAESRQPKAAPVPAQAPQPPTPAEAVQPPAANPPEAVQSPPVNPAPGVAVKPAAEAAVPPLPPAVSIAPSPQQAAPDHPVPPESIPDTAATADTEVAKADEHRGSRIGKWISGIPLIGSIVENGRQQ
ncbi:MAG TPA: hypothetical protein VJR71_05955 [Pseudolabrys sp.]|nr:hypothetical protein [Pseudolabrys sp.]